jgi:hypothetical protein
LIPAGKSNAAIALIKAIISLFSQPTSGKAGALVLLIWLENTAFIIWTTAVIYRITIIATFYTKTVRINTIDQLILVVVIVVVADFLPGKTMLFLKTILIFAIGISVVVVVESIVADFIGKLAGGKLVAVGIITVDKFITIVVYFVIADFHKGGR